MKAVNRPTILDLEKATGFSRGTISRAFNNRSEVSAKSREIIVRKAKEIGYVPNPRARSLSLGTTGRWGLLLPHLRNPFHADLMECLDVEAQRRHTLLLVGLSHHDHDHEMRLMHHWASGETDGIIIAQLIQNIDPQVFELIRSGQFPAVFLYGRPSSECDMVRTETTISYERAMNHLLNSGHQRIAYLGLDYCGDPINFVVYKKILAEAQIPLDQRLIRFCSNDSVSVSHALAEWLDLENPPTAVLCFNDIVACWLIHMGRSRGLRIPEDLSIIGGDDIAEAGRIGLTTIRTDASLIAQGVFDLLDHPRKEGEPGRVCSVLSDMITRDTVAPPRNIR